MFLNNPYADYQVTTSFGENNLLPSEVTNYYDNMKGNQVGGNSWNVQFYPHYKKPITVTKAGASMNIPPKPLPKDMVGIKFPQYSRSSGSIIEQQQNGMQLGVPDVYRDNPYSNWTTGIQYYTVYQGNNPKTEITPVIYPQAYRKEVWAADTVTFPQVNQRDTQDITYLEMDYSCRENCPIPNWSLGTPVPVNNLVPNAPLEVNPIGMYPNIGEYTDRQIGRNSRSYPPPVNPILELQRRKIGLPPTPVLDDFMNDEYTREIVQMGFSVV